MEDALAAVADYWRRNRLSSMNNHQGFWQWLKYVRAQIGSGSEKAREVLPRELNRVSAATQTQLFDSYHRLLDRANRLDVWEACSLISGSPCSDDSFEYFRNWLMWQGEDVYSRAVRSPDELAGLIEDKVIGAADPFFEPLGLCATVGSVAVDSDADSRTSGEPMSVGDFTPKFDWRESTSERMARNLPRLWQMFGSAFKTVDQVIELASREQRTQVPALANWK